MSKCFQAASAARARSKSARPRPIATVSSSRCWRAEPRPTMPIGPYDNGKSLESTRNRSMAGGDGRRAKNMMPSRRHWTADERVANELVDGDHKPANGRHAQRESDRWQELLSEYDQRVGCTLVCALVQQPPQEHRQMHEIQEAAEGFSERRFRRIGGSGNRVLEHALHAQTGERRTRRKNTFFRIANQDRRQRTKRLLMRLQDMQAGLQREDEAITPFPGRHLRGLPGIVR